MEQDLQDLLKKYRYASRLQKALKIEKILLDAYGEYTRSNKICCLDLGCSIGVITSNFSNVFENVFGVELDKQALRIATIINRSSEHNFIGGDALALPFRDRQFDVILCAQVYEHTQDPPQLFKEIDRVLKVGGCCFFSGPNKWWPFEYHFNWLFIHWFPKRIVDLYCHYRHSQAYDLVLYNYWQLKRCWKNYELLDYSLRLLYDSERFLNQSARVPWIRFIPVTLLSPFKFLFPNFNWVLFKKYESIE